VIEHSVLRLGVGFSMLTSVIMSRILER